MFYEVLHDSDIMQPPSCNQHVVPVLETREGGNAYDARCRVGVLVASGAFRGGGVGSFPCQRPLKSRASQSGMVVT